MKSNSQRSAGYATLPCQWILAALALFTLVCQAKAQLRPTHREEVPSIDNRAAITLPANLLAAREAGKNHLQSMLASVTADLDPLLESPSFVRASDGFLTGPGGQGKAVSSSALQGLS